MGANASPHQQVRGKAAVPPPAWGVRRETAMTAANPHFLSGALFLCLGDYPSQLPGPEGESRWPFTFSGHFAARTGAGGGSLRSPPQPPQRQEHLQAATTG